MWYIKNVDIPNRVENSSQASLSRSPSTLWTITFMASECVIGLLMPTYYLRIIWAGFMLPNAMTKRPIKSTEQTFALFHLLWSTYRWEPTKTEYNFMCIQYLIYFSSFRLKLWSNGGEHYEVTKVATTILQIITYVILTHWDLIKISGILETAFLNICLNRKRMYLYQNVP